MASMVSRGERARPPSPPERIRSMVHVDNIDGHQRMLVRLLVSQQISLHCRSDMDRRCADVGADFQDTLETKRAHQIVQSPPVSRIYGAGLHILNYNQLLRSLWQERAIHRVVLARLAFARSRLYRFFPVCWHRFQRRGRLERIASSARIFLVRRHQDRMSSNRIILQNLIYRFDLSCPWDAPRVSSIRCGGKFRSSRSYKS